MSETPRAICEPEPSAIESRAAFIAGTSLTPSPTIAGVAAAAAESLDQRLLLVGLTRAKTACAAATSSSAAGRRQIGAGDGAGVGEPGRARHGRDRARRVARHHLQVDALRRR